MVRSFLFHRFPINSLFNCDAPVRRRSLVHVAGHARAIYRCRGHLAAVRHIRVLRGLTFVINVRYVHHLVRGRRLEVFVGDTNCRRTLALSLTSTISLRTSLHVVPREGEVSRIAGINRYRHVTGTLRVRLFLPRNGVVYGHIERSGTVLRRQATLHAPRIQVCRVRENLACLSVPFVQDVGTGRRLSRHDLTTATHARGHHRLIFKCIRIRVVRRVIAVHAIVARQRVLSACVAPFQGGHRLENGVLLFVLLPVGLIRTLRASLHVLRLLYGASGEASQATWLASGVHR